MLRLGAILNFSLSAGHLLCIPWLERLFGLYRIDSIMNDLAQYGVAIPYLLTIGVAIGFFVCGLYALSTDGAIRRLPLLWTGIFIIASVFLLRAIIGMIAMIYTDNYPFIETSATTIAAIIGISYLFGGINALKHHSIR